ncbi:hypothetical protein EON65_36900 [archaeon]|nr:MAG: hypothetical protein EON65_36900 [archaeon]
MRSEFISGQKKWCSQRVLKVAIQLLFAKIKGLSLLIMRVWTTLALLGLLILAQERVGANSNDTAVVEPAYPLMFPNATLYPMLDKPLLFQKLVNISQAITMETKNCWGFNYAGSTRQIAAIKNIAQGLPVVPQRQCVSANEMGNHLGYFFNDLACSDLVGAHFVTTYHRLYIISKKDPITDKDINTEKEAHDLYTFLKALPNLVIHPNPTNISYARAMVDKVCPCILYCWEDQRSPWLKRVDMIGKHMKAAIEQYVNETHLEDIGTVVGELDLISGHKRGQQPSHLRRRKRMISRMHLTPSHPLYKHANLTVENTHTDLHPDAWLPLVPNVTIQYRCGDNLNFHDGKYGVVPFRIYNKKRILTESKLKESEVEYIYVLTEHLARAKRGPCSTCCERIIHRLLAYLTYLFPNAVVLVKRGDNVFADYARIAFSKVVFCSASTFCLWPALANNQGTVFLPYTSLIAGAVNATVAPDLGQNRKFIDIEMVSKYEKSVENLLAQLE